MNKKRLKKFKAQYEVAQAYQSKMELAKESIVNTLIKKVKKADDKGKKIDWLEDDTVEWVAQVCSDVCCIDDSNDYIFCHRSCDYCWEEYLHRLINQ